MSMNKYCSYNDNPFRVSSDKFRVYPHLKKVTDGYDTVHKLGDQEERISIYPNAYEDFRKLNSMAISILSYMFKEICYDYVKLNAIELMSLLDVKSKSNIYRGIEDLLEKKFIAKKAGTDVYFINPSKIFKGKRSEWYKKTIEFDENYDGLMTTINTDE